LSDGPDILAAAPHRCPSPDQEPQGPMALEPSAVPASRVFAARHRRFAASVKLADPIGFRPTQMNSD
jgi:hypothetical protein